MDDAKQQLVEKLKTANNVLVTVSRNPSVDQLSACIGLALMLNNLGKHAAAVFSGEIPSTIEFLQPEDTLEKTTDSLRDFIIALDKSKADKLRYKVEDNVVRIFITPYRTSITQSDLEFSQGDFNVDVVVALGVKQQEDLDAAITAHGRIMHDAAMTTINTSQDGGLGAINWHDQHASSLSELVTDLALALGDKALDNQTATALLTGIVAETGRFSNEKTSSQTMSASAALMAAGANQQLVASELDASGTLAAVQSTPKEQPNPDGTIEINHDDPVNLREPAPAEIPTAADEQQQISDRVTDFLASTDGPNPAPGISQLNDSSRMMTEPPVLGGTLTANTSGSDPDAIVDPLSLPSSNPTDFLAHNSGQATADATPLSQPPAGTPSPDDTLADLEKLVESPHADQPAPTPAPAPAPAPEPAPGNDIDSARDQISRALSDATAPPPEAPEPIVALNAQPLGEELHPAPAPEPAAPPIMADPTPTGPAGPPPQAGALPHDPNSTNPMDNVIVPPSEGATQTSDPNAAPPVPPPIPFQFGNPPA